MILKYKGKVFDIQTRNSQEVADFCHTTGLKAFSESAGNYNIVFYQPDLYTVEMVNGSKYLVYTGESECPQQPLNVSTLRYMFNGYSHYNLDLRHWDTSNVEDMSFLFSGKMRSVDIAGWSFQKCNTIESMFRDCAYLINMHFIDGVESAIANARNMFSGCVALTNAHVTLTSKHLECIENMFSGCTSLSSVDLCDFNTDKVVSLSRMFFGCANLYLADFKNWTNYRFNMLTEMFYGCKSLYYVDLAKFSQEGFTRGSLKYYLDGCTTLQANIENKHTDMFRTLRSWIYSASIYDSADLYRYVKHFDGLPGIDIEAFRQRNNGDLFLVAKYINSLL